MRFDPNDYIDVQQRVVRFWEEYPDGAILTALESNPDTFDQVVFKATVYKHRDDQNPSSTGYAAEMKGGSHVNQTNWHENGESSAIGRALANLGYATSIKDRPSKQEMEKAQRHSAPAAPAPQPQPPRPQPVQPVPAQPRPAQNAGGPPLTENQGRALHALAGKIWGNDGHDNLTTVVKKQYNLESVNDLTKQQASQLIGAFNENPGSIDRILKAEDYSDTPELMDKERIA